MNRAEAFPSQYISQEDVKDRTVRLTIADVRTETINSDSGADDKPVMLFHEKDTKNLILNAVNWDTIADAYGPDSTAWVGKQIDLYQDRGVMYGKKRVGGVRVRIPAGTGTTSPTEGTLTWDAALAACAAFGLSKQEIVARLQVKGLNGYNAARDTSVIEAIIEEAKTARQIADMRDEPMPGEETDVPF